jgi:Amt family ammonium transporter
MRAMVAVFNTNVAASTGAIEWVLIDYVKHGRRFSVTGVCEKIIAGLVGITPAAGYMSVWCAAAIGFITAIAISRLQNINDWIGIDEGMDVFKLHGMEGIVGSFLTGIFATASVSSLDGITLAPGGTDGNGVQVGKQFAEIVGVSSYAFTVSLILATFSNTSYGCTCASVTKRKQSGWILISSSMNKLVTGSFLTILAGSHRIVR